MKSRQEKIYELTKYELQWFLSNGDDWVEDFSKFFAKGGFNNWTDKQLDKKYQLQIAEEQL